MISPARATAFEILRLVERGGFASELLVSRSAGLDSRDAGLASEIVFGSLRYQAQLDFLIARFSGREPARLDAEVRIALRIAIYQIRYLSRVPAHAAAGESVELVKRARKRSAAPFVNAVLRKIDREAVEWPDRATELSHPAWILERWDAQYGCETADRIARAGLAPPETYVRAPGGSPPGLNLEPTEVTGCYRVPISGTGYEIPKQSAPCFQWLPNKGFRSLSPKLPAEGWRIQDIGSQTIVPLLELEPGHTFLDLCAAPGNKTAQALESGVRAVACDIHLSRLEHMQGLGCTLVALDGTRPLPFRRRFDRILVDAPCSGTGTLARNPEIKWRLRPSDLPDLQERQVRLLRNALESLEAGGRLVYSTCSLEKDENEAVVEQAGAKIRECHRRIPGVQAGDGFFAAVLTSE